jgi:hypothetical protein
VADTIPKRKLKSLAERKAQMQRDRATPEMRQQRVRANKALQLAGQRPVVVPLSGHYRKSDEREAERAAFYGHMNLIFGLEGWQKPGRFQATGRSGSRDVEKRKILTNNRRSDIVKEDINAAPFEWLWRNRRLRYLPDTVDIEDIEAARIHAGIAFREEWELGQVTELRSPDWLSGGGGSFGPRSLSATKVECLSSIGELSHNMKSIPRIPEMGDIYLFNVLEEVVVKDRFLWRGMKGDEHKRAIRTVLCALDCAAIHYAALSLSDFRDLWPEVKYMDRPL